MNKPEIEGKNILVMGIGLHGGGVETARWLSRHGANVTCTDLKDKKSLEKSINALNGLGIRFVLGKHDHRDFDKADMIVKNPAVPIDNPLLKGRHNIETDISLFLQSTQNPLLAVTGSKGKSTVATCLYDIIGAKYPQARLGGNITINPLSFVDDLDGQSPVVLELSSWQLADIQGKGILKPAVCCITNLMRDHQNRYKSMQNYENDKKVIFENSFSDSWAVFPSNADGQRWKNQCKAQTLMVSASGNLQNNNFLNQAWIDNDGVGWFESQYGREKIVPKNLNVPGEPFRINALFAAVMARLWGLDGADICSRLVNFAGIPYRMEHFLKAKGVHFYDDTTATIPDAASAAVRAFDTPVILVAGGNDKALNFTPFDQVALRPKRILMLSGTATNIWLPRLKQIGAAVEGPFDRMEGAVQRALALAESGDSIVLSPGATSFGMFAHEFERGDAFKATCRKLASQ